MAVNLVQGKQIATASWAINALTASYLDGYTSPFPFTGSALITGSLGITGSASILSGSLTIDSVAAANTLILSGSTPTITLYSSGSVSSNGRIIVEDRAWGSKPNETDSQDSFLLQLRGSGSIPPVGSIRFRKSSNSRSNILISPGDTDIAIYISGSGNVGIGTTRPTSASLHVNGNVFANSYTGSLFGTASFATSASFAISSSRAVTSSFAISSSWAPTRPGGSDTQIQFNSGSTLVGTGSFTFDYIDQSLQQGFAVTASGLYSHAEGRLTRAVNLGSHAEGESTIASGDASHAEGFTTIAAGPFSHAEGFTTQAPGYSSHAEGAYTQAIGVSSHAEGNSTQAIGNYSHAEGASTQAIGEYSHAEGDTTITGNTTAWSTQKNPIVDGLITLGEDQTTYFTPGGYLYLYDPTTITRPTYLIDTVTFNGLSTLIQLVDTSINVNNVVFGDITYLLNNGTFGGIRTIPGNYSHAEGSGTQAVGNYSHAEGNLTNALGNYSHAEGFDTLTQGSYSHAEGRGTYAQGVSSHAEGQNTTASADYSHTEGYITKTGITTAFTTREGDGVGSGLVRIDSTYGDVTAYFTPGNYLYLYDNVFNNTYGYASFLIDTVTWNDPETFIQLVDTSVTTATAYVGDLAYLKNNGTFGGNKTIPGNYSHAEGFQTQAIGYSSHAEGTETQTVGSNSHAEGAGTQALGISSHAEGATTISKGDYSHAEGSDTVSSGSYSHAEGELTIASGYASHAEGNITKAIGDYSHAEGDNTQAKGNYSHAEGQETISSGSYSHAEGYATIASGSYSHAEGARTQATGAASHTEGFYTTASGYASHAEGENTTAIGDYSHAEGRDTISIGIYSHAEGIACIASGSYSHAEGNGTTAIGSWSHTEGLNTITSGSYSHAEGFETIASGSYSHAEGRQTIASGSNSHAEGDLTISSGQSSHAEGFTTIASGDASHAEGFTTIASGSYSHAEGNTTLALGTYSHAEGQNTRAIGNFSHAEGDSTTAQGNGSHAEGVVTLALGLNSHAEGLLTSASANYSHAEGQQTQARGEASHAEGLGTVALGSYQHAQGQYNISSSAQSAFIIGNGTSDSTRSNLVFAAGNTVQVTGSVIATQGFTGSLLGTAATASFAPAYLPLSGGTISGSLTITNNLTVLGSASIQYISESTLNIGTNLITVNTLNPGARFGGLAVIDSGSSPQVSASFLYDSVQDEFIFVHRGTSTSAITSSHFLVGPETYNDLGNELYLTANRIPKGKGNEHLNDSNISDDGSVVSINSNTQVTGSLNISGSLTISGSTNAFVQGGNSFGATALLGTNDNQSLALETSGSTRMFISSSGDIGIGTITPSDKLSISAGNILIDNGRRLKWVDGSFIEGAGASSIMTFRSLGNYYFNGGDIGIGTTTPSSKLTIRTDGTVVATTENTGLFLENTTAATAGVTQQFSPSIVFSGNAWKTQVPAASQNMKYKIECQPRIGSSHAESVLNFMINRNNAGWIDTGTYLYTDRFGFTNLYTSAIVTNGISGLAGLSITKGNPINTTETFVVGGANYTLTTGTNNGVSVTLGTAPTSGTHSYNGLSFSGTINQTGGANGITRGLFITPTLTSASDWRAIETTQGRNVLADTFAASGSANSGSLLDLRQTWNTTGQPSAIRLNVTDTASNFSSRLLDLQTGGVSRFFIRKDGSAFGLTFNTTDGFMGYGSIISIQSVNAGYFQSSTGRALRLVHALTGSQAGEGVYVHSALPLTLTSGQQGSLGILDNFSPTSGTAVYNAINLSGSINQTGGANGITRGLYVNQILTSAADFRAIETVAGSNLLNSTSGNTYVGLSTNTGTARLQVRGTGATSSTNTLILQNSSLTNLLTVRDDGSSTLIGRLNITPTTSTTSSLVVTGPTLLSGSQNTISGSVLTVVGSGSAQPVFTVQGSQGELFSVTDSLSGSLFSVNDISGLPIVEVFSDGTTLMGNYLDPMLVTTAKNVLTNSGSFTVYSLPTASYDTAFYDYSVRSGSNARAGQIMAIQSGSVVNYTETTTMDFGSTSGLSLGVFVSGSNMVLTGSAATTAWTIKTIIRGI
jgi:hypothetical protein